jgi:hypothetical protein
MSPLMIAPYSPFATARPYSQCYNPPPFRVNTATSGQRTNVLHLSPKKHVTAEDNTLYVHDCARPQTGWQTGAQPCMVQIQGAPPDGYAHVTCPAAVMPAGASS